MTRAGVTATLAPLSWRYAIGALSGVLLFAASAAAQTPQSTAMPQQPTATPAPAVRSPQPAAARPQLTLAPNPQPAAAPAAQTFPPQSPYSGYPLQDWHRKLFTEAEFPSAVVCSQCHRRIFEEWTSSNHAYASISPMFHKFDQRIQELASGTIGTFCVRCHQQVGTERGEPRAAPLWERSAVASEGRHLRHLSPGQPGMDQGERRAERRPRTDYSAGYRAGGRHSLPRRCQQSQGVQGLRHTELAGFADPSGRPQVRPDREVRVLRVVPSGGGASRHRARGGVEPVPRLAGDAAGHQLPGLPHGQGAGRQRGL